MNFQIMDIVLYGKNGEKRIISFNLGDLNIITGFSETGKTALLEIIDYCFCSDSCNIPGGIIRRSLEWVGIRLKTNDGEIFVGRKMPEKDFNSSEKVYYNFSNKVEIPENSEIHQNENVESLKYLLSYKLGITENLHYPLEGQTRPPLKANIKHSLIFNLQHQNDIDNNRYLFHNQWKDYVSQSIKDTFPYFLGAVDDDYVAKKETLTILKRRLKSLKIELNEIESIKGEGITRARILLTDAENMGFKVEIYDNLFNNIQSLKKVQKLLLSEKKEHIENLDILERLQKERETLKNEYRKINQQLKYADIVITDRNGFSEEVIAQKNRLQSIELFDDLKPKKSSCPLCHSDISDKQLPQIEDIKDSIQKLDSQLPLMKNPSPKMLAAIRNLENRLDDIKSRLEGNQEQIEYLTLTNEKIKNMRDFNEQKAYLSGKIDLYLENLPKIEETTDLRREIDSLDVKIALLKDEIDDERIKKRLDKYLRIISKYMGDFATELGLEHSKHPLWLDINKLTVIAETPEETLTLKTIGSGQNWVGYHLITFLALNKWFVEQKRPVSQFLFLDQLSKGHFPADDEDENMEKAKNDDREIE